MCSMTPSFDSSFVLNALRIVQHGAVPVAQDVRAEPAGQAEHPRLQARREDRLHHGLAGLEVLARDRHAARFASSWMAGRSTVRFGAPFANGTPSMSAAHA
jgi:hypothetical protein